MGVLVPTRVLVGPLHGEYGVSVIVEITDVVATAVIILGVKHSRKKEKGTGGGREGGRRRNRGGGWEGRRGWREREGEGVNER